jgi:DNA-binding response OmpR family regulator
MSAAPANTTIIVHENPRVAGRIATWLSHAYGVRASVVARIEELRSELELFEPDAVVVEREQLPKAARDARRLFETYSGVPIVVLDDHPDEMVDRLWRGLGAAGCVAADSLEDLLDEIIGQP